MFSTPDPRPSDNGVTDTGPTFATNGQSSDQPYLTVQSKFLDAVRRAAEAKYLQPVIHYETPNEGYCYIQKKDSFVNLYAFHFKFGKTNAEIYPGTDNITNAPAENRRTVELSDGAKIEEVLAEILRGVEEASRAVYSELKALSQGATVSSLSKTSSTASPWPQAASGASGAGDQYSRLTRRASARERQNAANVWGQNEIGVHAKEDSKPFQQESHRVRNAAVLLLVVFVFLLFIPVFSAQSSTSNCNGRTCTARPMYYASFTTRYFGIGGVFLPSGQGWSPRTFVGRTDLPIGGNGYGFGFWYYYFCI